jgi:hypothetical protein
MTGCLTTRQPDTAGVRYPGFQRIREDYLENLFMVEINKFSKEIVP